MDVSKRRGAFSTCDVRGCIHIPSCKSVKLLCSIPVSVCGLQESYHTDSVCELCNDCGGVRYEIDIVLYSGYSFRLL